MPSQSRTCWTRPIWPEGARSPPPASSSPREGCRPWATCPRRPRPPAGRGRLCCWFRPTRAPTPGAWGSTCAVSPSWARPSPPCIARTTTARRTLDVDAVADGLGDDAHELDLDVGEGPLLVVGDGN